MQKTPERASWIIVFLLTLSAGLCGCGRSKSSDSNSNNSNGSAGSSASAAAKSTAKPGYIVGKITRPDGSPIGITGATFSVFITGVSGPGENVGFSPPVASDGTFSFPVPSGIYHATQASIKITFDDALFIYNLVPTSMFNDTQSDAGIVADFVWQISGPTPMYKDHPDPGNLTSWFGGSMDADWEPTYTDSTGQLHNLIVPAGAKFVFTATPNGKLIDGTDGKSITINRDFSPDSVVPPNLNDLPPAVNGWHITGKELRTDGSSVALELKKTTDPKYASSVDVKIRPDGYTGVTGWPLAVTQPPP
jgi:hypothetical protein